MKPKQPWTPAQKAAANTNATIMARERFYAMHADLLGKPKVKELVQFPINKTERK